MAIDSKHRIYVADKDQIHVYNLNGKKEFSIKNILNFCRKIAISNDKIFALDESETGYTLKVLDLNGTLIDQFQVQLARYVRKMDCKDDMIFFLQSEEIEGKNHITVLNMKTLQTEKLNVNDNVLSFTPYRDNTILLYVENDYTPYYLIYDLGEKKGVKGFPDYITIKDIKYDPEDDTVYYIRFDKAGKLDLENSESETIYRKDEIIFDKVDIAGDVCVIMSIIDKTIYLADKNNTVAQNQTKLSILSSRAIDMEFRMNKTMNLIDKGNYDIKVTFKTIDPGTYKNHISTKLMSGDSDFDIFVIYLSDLNNLAKKNCLHVLNSYQNIMDSFDKMFDGIKDLCSYEGNVVAVPYLVGYQTWAVNEELLEKLDIELPEGSWTWDEFYEFAKTARKDIDGDGKADTYALQCDKAFAPFLVSYNCQYADFSKGIASYDNEVFKNLLRIWKKLWDENLVKNGEYYNYRPIDDVLFYTAHASLEMGNRIHIYPPCIGEDMCYPTDGEAFVINARSKNIDACIKFLDVYLQPEVQTINAQVAFFKDPAPYSESDLFKRYGSELSNEVNYKIYETIVKNSARVQFNPDLQIS